MKIGNITNLYESHPFVRKQNKEFELVELPFERQALEPHMSRETLDLHYGKHHQTYVDNLNKFMTDKDYADMNLRDIVKKSNERDDRSVFNNASQNLNHIIFWNCLSPKKFNIPSTLQATIIRELDSINEAREKFIDLGLKQFGSGWVWLVKKDGGLDIVNTANGVNPIIYGQEPLMGADVWEHAYYVDYKNDRKTYLETFWDELVNWDYVELQLNQA